MEKTSPSQAAYSTIHMGMNVRFPSSSSQANTNRRSDPVYLEHMPHPPQLGARFPKLPPVDASHKQGSGPYFHWLLVN